MGEAEEEERELMRLMGEVKARERELWRAGKGYQKGKKEKKMEGQN